MESIRAYKKLRRKKFIFIGVLLCLCFLLFLLGLGVGSSSLSFRNAFLAFFGKGESGTILIVRKIRILRMLTAFLVGGSLALSGCLLQTVLLNPMASPSTLGVSNGGVFGACLSIVLFPTLTPYGTTLFAFLFALLSALFILLFSTKKKHNPETVVLCGVALGSLFSAGVTFLQAVATDTALTETVFWQMGDLGRATYEADGMIAIVLFLSFFLSLILSVSLNGLQNGEETAHGLGVSVRKVRFLALFLSSLLGSVCVANVGLIGFIGLVAPHIAQKTVGNDHRFLLPSSLLIGSSFLMLSDILSRTVPSGLPVGAVTALFGAPLFIAFLLTKKRYASC